jgi:VRR-NUC domain-containing protein
MRETELQAAAAVFLAHALPSEAIAHHSPNEGKRGWRAQRDIKTNGMVKGFPDWVILWQSRAYLIELKAPKKYPDATQREIHRRLREGGFPVFICRSLVEIEMALVSVGIPLSAKVAA